MNIITTELIYREKMEITIPESGEIMEEINLELDRDQAIELVESIIKTMQLDVVKAPLSGYMKIT